MPQLTSIWQNRWSIAGAVMAVLAILSFISFQAIELASPLRNPYVGLWTFLVLPAVMVIGLILIPLGYIKERRRRRRLYPEVKEWPPLPRFDPNNPRHRKGLWIFVFGTLLVLPLIGISSYQGYHYTDSTQFCGQVCHTVMIPEFTTYVSSPHARVSCAACHIGPGASWYVKSKLSGVRQVIAVTFNTYSRPIPTPIEDLRPARETCEECHWPAKFYGAQLRIFDHYASDEKNTRREIRMLMKTGGAESSMGVPSGIHWHMALSRKIEYVAVDRTRQTIPWVRSVDGTGQVTIYRSDGKKSGDPPPAGELRVLDCMDCHNRPTHIILSPSRAVDISLQTGRIDPALPYIKKFAVEALTNPYSSTKDADETIASYIRDAYQKHDPKLAGQSQSSIENAITELRSIYRRNFFPQMNVGWRTYSDDIGHLIFDGCFRCHDRKHVSDDKGTIRQECSICHDFLEPVPNSSPVAYVEKRPTHPYKLEGIHAEINCSRCHTGGRAPIPSCSGCHTTQALFRQGRGPLLREMKPTPPSFMAELGCEDCHDLSQPPSVPVSDHCATCHEKGYGDMVKMWIEDARTGRDKAASAIGNLQGRLENGTLSAVGRLASRSLIQELQNALEQVDKAGPQHNLDLAGALYEQIGKMAEEAGKRP